ncbi:MAG: methionine--tRNA ligase [Candidatus Paceibacterota bacterium]
MPKKGFYLTTSIAYTNASPHVGFALELIQADVIARYRRILDNSVFFLTGTDEHGAKITKAAEKAGKSPEEFTEEISNQFRELTKVLKLSNDDFIRTTDQKRHWPVVQYFWLKLVESGDIYKKEYRGVYCVGCEAFITKKDLVDGKCKIHQKEPEIVEEENYFFKLSKYSKKIGEIIKKDKVKIIPEERKNEMMSFINQGLEDVSFSRPRKDLRWGVPVPGDDSQTIYVWADALVNYISALGGLKGDNFKKYWPPDIHFLGKDILRFHATIWLGMLLSLKLPLPKAIFVHGFISSAGQKMSKSLGNVVDPFELVNKYGVDAVRYFLLREIPSTDDGDFTYDKFEKRYNSDLAGGLGNLVARVVTIADKSGIQPSKQVKNAKMRTILDKTKNNYKKALGEFKFNEALVLIWDLIGFCDRHIEKEKPWQAGKNQKEVIGDLMLIISDISEMLKSFLPETSEKISGQIKIKKSEPLFPRI